MTRYAAWLAKRGVHDVLNFSEALLHDYVKYLADSERSVLPAICGLHSCKPGMPVCTRWAAHVCRRVKGRQGIV